MMEDSQHVPLFGSFPTRGIWTSLALTRFQFLFVLGASIALFLFVDGPLWEHLRASHFTRIAVSYLFIPPAVAAALYRNRKLTLVTVLVASAVIALIKLVLTAVVMVGIGIGMGG